MRFRPWSLPIAALVVATACGVGNITAVLEPETGTGDIYRLISFNNKTVPAVVVEGQTTVEIKSGALTLAADSTWIVSFVVRQSAGGSESNNLQTSRGNYSVTNGTLNLRYTGETLTRLSGAYSATEILLRDVTVVSGDQMLFRK